MSKLDLFVVSKTIFVFVANNVEFSFVRSNNHSVFMSVRNLHNSFNSAPGSCVCLVITDQFDDNKHKYSLNNNYNLTAERAYFIT